MKNFLLLLYRNIEKINYFIFLLSLILLFCIYIFNSYVVIYLFMISITITFITFKVVRIKRNKKFLNSPIRKVIRATFEWFISLILSEVSQNNHSFAWVSVIVLCLMILSAVECMDYIVTMFYDAFKDLFNNFLFIYFISFTLMIFCFPINTQKDIAILLGLVGTLMIDTTEKIIVSKRNKVNSKRKIRREHVHQSKKIALTNFQILKAMNLCFSAAIYIEHLFFLLFPSFIKIVTFYTISVTMEKTIFGVIKCFFVYMCVILLFYLFKKFIYFCNKNNFHRMKF